MGLCLGWERGLLMRLGFYLKIPNKSVGKNFNKTFYPDQKGINKLKYQNRLAESALSRLAS